MLCPRCGATNDSTTRYCTACGTDLQVYRQETAQTPGQAVSGQPPHAPVYRYQRKSSWLVIPVALILAGVWVWATYSMPGGLSREDVPWGFAWVFPIFMLLVGLVFTPLYELLQWREVTLSQEEVVFRSRGGRAQTTIRPVDRAVSVKRGNGVKFEGLGPKGRHIARTVIRGHLGRKRFRELQEDVDRLFGGGTRP